jgi:hypothetical protein
MLQRRSAKYLQSCRRKYFPNVEKLKMRISDKYWQCCRGEYFLIIVGKFQMKYLPNIGNIAEENICHILTKLQRRVFSKC